MFRGRALPEPASPAGYAALIDRFDLPVPLPSRLTAIASRERSVVTPFWRLVTPRDRPADTIAGQLAFALASEGVNLEVLAALFEVITPTEISAIIATEPAGAVNRRLWFLYEWLTGREVDITEPAGRLEFVPILDPEAQVALEIGVPSARHRVIDNLPGTPRYCPMVRWTAGLRSAAAKKLDDRARAILWTGNREQRRRVEELLQLAEARSSFALERQSPSSACEARWADAIGQAGVRALTLPEVERLQRLCGGETRVARVDIPRPAARTALDDERGNALRGIVDYTERALCGSVDPVVLAAATAFGFAYLQRFVAGHRLIHRWLVHYVLDAAGYRPPGGVLPISAAFVRAVDQYERLLTGPSHRSRYFDATEHAEFLYRSVEQTVEYDLPHVVRSLDASPHEIR
ncbi:MAG TPA: hypothetical protein VFJ02_16005 [Vicinamibacterales bacterium]|nr:hypothetical protein [Vicinamibacterales bacterium]